MRSTIRGSVINETIFMRAPQAQSRGSTSKIFLIRRAHELRVSLEKSELSYLRDVCDVCEHSMSGNIILV